MDSMRAVVKAEEGPGSRFEQVAIPGLSPLDVLVKVEAASICGTDVRIHDWDRWAQTHIDPPLVYGHEFCGEVVEAGSAVSRVQVGDFVAVEGHLACETCPTCHSGLAHLCERGQMIGVDRPGGFAEFAALPETCVYPLDRSLPREVAALHDPFGLAVHAVLAGEVVGLDVAVVGCGPVGCCAVAVARAAGARRVLAADIRSSRLEIARKMGADQVVDASATDPSEWVRGATGGRGASVVIEATGHRNGLREALQMLARGGRAALLGGPEDAVPVDLMADVVTKGAIVQGINGRRLWKTWEQAQALLSSGRVDLKPLISHTLPLSRFEEGMDLMRRHEAHKVILLPGA
jgi:threonine 3-dehydrogenase